ncbi:MAG: squalene synthase HpnC [Acidobacteriota bacterium]
MVTAAEAYASCERLAREHDENFPVASLLLPAGMRPHIAAIYAFARTADDFADEGERTPEQRLHLLDDWLGQLHEELGIRKSAHLGPARALPVLAGSAVPQPNRKSRIPNPVVIALAETIRTHALPVSLFEDLISAFKQDTTVTRYECWDDVLDYCRRSANPVGRLVLRVAGAASDEGDLASDAVCTALQLTNFWQDLERDWAKGRLYVPRQDRDRFGASEEDLDARRLTPAWRLVMGEMAARTTVLFERGRPVCDMVQGRLRWELRLTWLGGRRILTRLERGGFDVFAARPVLGVADVPSLLWQALLWRPPAGAGAPAQA